MATRTYIGVNSKARKVKAIYVGDNGKARSVKAVYIGVSGKARLCWRRPGLWKYKGSIDPLLEMKSYLGAASIGDYALFAGGRIYKDSRISVTASVDAYNSTLVRSTAPSLNTARERCAGATIGPFALFVCGSSKCGFDAYNSSLTRTTGAEFDLSGYYPVGTTSGNYALFGGCDNGYTIYAIDKDLTKAEVFTTLREAKCLFTAITIGDHALFGGGSKISSGGSGAHILDLKTVDAYNLSLTRVAVSDLRSTRSNCSSAIAGNYALIGGDRSNKSKYVDGYDASLTRISAPDLSCVRYNSNAITVGRYALFSGGEGDYVNGYADYHIDVYDSYLTHTTDMTLSQYTYKAGAASVGKYSIIAGGRTQSVKPFDVFYDYRG